MQRSKIIELKLTKILVEKTKRQILDERELDDVLIDLTEKLIAHCTAPRYKFLNYLFGMVYLELTNLAEKTESTYNQNCCLISCKPKDVNN